LFREQGQRGNHGQHGRKEVDGLVHVPRDDLLLQEEFHRVGQGLEDAVRPRAVRPQAHLKARDQLPLEQGQVRGPREQDEQDDDAFDEWYEYQADPVHR